MAINFNINTLHSDSFSCTFSNFPSISAVGDLSQFDYFVKSLTIPEYSMEEIYSDSLAYRVRHPSAPKINANLQQVSIEFKVNEDMSNYLKVFEYMQQLRNGELDLDSNDDTRIRKYVIKSIILNILDNQKREIARMRFTDAFVLSLSSLNLTTGSADELTFTINCSYAELLYERLSIFN